MHNFSEKATEDEWDIARQEFETKYSLQKKKVSVSVILKMIQNI